MADWTTINKAGSVVTATASFASSIPWAKLGFLVGVPGARDDAEAWVTTMPSYIYVPILLLIGAWLGYAWASDILRWTGDWPDFDKWDQQKEFRLWEAACLWEDVEPKYPMPRRCRRRFQKLEKAIRAREMEVRRDDRREVINDAITEANGKPTKANPNWVVKKEDIQNYLVGRTERPKFLFPKERV